MEAATSSFPPAAAPTFALVVWIRPEVQLPPDFRAVMTRWPLPSRCTLEDELVMVSISPVPNEEPGRVSNFPSPPGPAPDAPAKLSLKTVDQPLGGAGTVTAFAVPDSGMTASRPAAAGMAGRRAARRRRVSRGLMKRLRGREASGSTTERQV